jgi:hypothetical protein
VGADITTSGASGAIRLKSREGIEVEASDTLQTNGADIVIWADSDANKDGHIITREGVTLSSSGGSITLAGGLDDGDSSFASGRTSADNLPDGYAYAGSEVGVLLGDLNTISSGSGDIFIAGHGRNLSTSNSASGVYVGAGTTIEASTGKIHIFGRSNGNSTTASYSEGIRLRGVDDNQVDFVSITNSSTATDAILLVGDASATRGQRASGISGLSWYNRNSGGPKNLIANSSSGGITLTGRGGQRVGTTSDITGSGLELSATAILSKSGTITLNGDTSTTSSDNAYGFS